MGTINRVQMMHKRTFPALFFVCFLLFIQNALGQEDNSMRIQGSLGLASMSDKNIASGFLSGFGFSVPIFKDVHLSLNFGAWKSQVSSKPDGLQAGTLMVNPFFASLYYFLKRGDRSITPYFFIGGGYIFSSFRMEDVASIPEITFSQKIDNAPGGQVGAGIKIKVSKRISLTGDVSYLYSKTSGTSVLRDLNSETITDDFSLILSAMIFQLGIQFLI